jgi:hypothetical protein
MVLHGKNLIISAGGKVLAGAKSCEVNVECDDIEVSSALSGSWKEFIAGRKEWSISTSQLQVFHTEPTDIIEAVGTSHNGVGSEQVSYCSINGSYYAGGTRGLQLRIFTLSSGQWVAQTTTTYDTYNDSSLCSTMANVIDSASAGSLVIITSRDAYALTSTLASKLSTKLGIPVARIPTVTASRASFVCVGVVGQSGISFTNTVAGSQVHARLLLDQQHLPITATPVKDALLSVGSTYTIQMQVDGLAADRLSGQALCKQARITATQGSLMSGSFQFKGSGALS